MWVHLIVILVVVAAWIVFGLVRQEDDAEEGCPACPEKDSCVSGCDSGDGHVHFEIRRKA